MPPTGSRSIASSNSGTNEPGEAQPRSPPCAALPSSEFSRASCSNVAGAGDDVALELRSAGAPPLPALSSGDGRSRMCRARDWSTVNALPLLALEQLEDVKAGAAAQQLRGDLARASDPATARTNRSGRRSTGRMPISPPCARLPSSETSRATAAKSSPPRTRLQRGLGARAALGDHRRRAAPSGTVTRICAMLICAPTPAALRRFSIRLVDLGVADLDPAHDLALAHPLDQHLVADVVAELGVTRCLPGAAARATAAASSGSACATLATARSSSASSIRAPLSRALVTSTRSSIRASSTCLRSVGGGGSGVRVARRLVAHACQPLLHLARRDQLLVDDGDDVVAASGAGARAAAARPSAPARDRARRQRSLQVSHTE